jgi:hypothetical protein
MPLDRRLRDELARAAAAVEPDVGARLEAVTRRASRRSGAGGRVVLSAVAVVVVLVLVRFAGVGPHLELAPGAAPSPGSGASAIPSSSASLRDGVTGTWTVTLPAAEPGVGTLGMVGDWTMRLGADSTVELSPPEGFDPPSGGDLGRYAYAVTGSSLVTNLFTRDFSASCAGSGRYTWTADHLVLRLSVTADTCEPRRVLLTTRAWSAAPAPTDGAAAR